MIKGFIFDLDNTLVDDDGGWDIALRKTCEYISSNFNIGYSKEEIYTAYKEVSDYLWSDYSKYLACFVSREEKREYVWKKTLEHMGGYQNELQIKNISEVFSVNRENNVIVCDYGRELLVKIKEMGFKVIICTDGEEKLQRMKCVKANINNLIDKIISATDLGCLKPNKKVFDKCIEYFGTEANLLLYIGDHEVKDIEGARCAGMQTIHVNGKDGVHIKDIYENIENIVKTGKFSFSTEGDYDVRIQGL